MSVFEFDNYRKFVRHAISTTPALGRGSVKKMATALRVHPSLISQVLSGSKDFTSEQANDIASFLNLNELETEYFLCLVDIERAGTSRLKTFLQNKLMRLTLSAPKTNRTNANHDSGADVSLIDQSKLGNREKTTIENSDGNKLMPWQKIGSDVSRRHSLTIPLAISQENRKTLQLMIDQFAAKIRETTDPSDADLVSVVTIDLFDIA
jgi:hypothetical protein